MLFFGLVGAFLLTVLPHLAQLPLWVSLSVIGAMIFRSIGEVRRWPLPSPAFCGVLALCLLTAIYIQFDTILGRDAGTAFMAALLAIKFFELRSSRDVALILFCSFFVVMSSLLYSQAIELFIYCLIMMWVLTALLLRTSMGDLPDARVVWLLRVSTLFFLQALPLTLFLFFFFPRYHGVLQLGMGDTSVGLTDKVEPGSISRLAEDDSTAMTVKINGLAIPTPDTMYWRALVLWNYEKGAWTPGPTFPLKRKDQSLPVPAHGSTDITQEITIYPHFHRWLFALDYPVSPAEKIDGTSGWSEFLNGGVLSVGESYGVLTHKERYVVTSSYQLAPQELNPTLEDAALALPNSNEDHIDPRVAALAAKLHEGCTTEDDYIRSVLHYFRHGGFVYSDAPGARGKNALADFLLIHKTGFCEHYASAFAVLMRLGKIPTRLVVGYQGAQFNPYKNIYVVKQSNAHSWDEVWIESEKSWRRVDPTAILSGHETLTGAATIAQGGSGEGLSIDVANHRFTLLSGKILPAWLNRTLIETQLRRQEVEADWDDWVFSYDPETQGRLAQALGFGQKTRTFLGLACLFAVAISCAVFGRAFARRPKTQPIENFYAKFCRSMAQRGVPREPWEGPLAYTERVAQAFPEARHIVGEVGKIVTQSRYGSSAPAASSADLKSLLRLLPAASSHGS